MAEVIRQRAQVFNKPVGVIRTQGGAAQLGQTISRVAGEMADRQYRLAAEDAQEAGSKAGMAVASSEIVAIDPETNMPVAYTPPPSFGRIAATSYQDLIDRRFADSLKSEIEAKGSEIAASSKSAAQYKDRMSNYVEAMYSADEAPTAYTRMIAEGGAQYIASTYKTLRNKEITAHKAAVLKSNEIESYKAFSSIKAMIVAGADPEEINKTFENEYARASSMFNMSGGITVSQFTSRIDKLNGLKSLQSNQGLVALYSGLGEFAQSKLEQAILNPQLLGQLDNIPAFDGTDVDVLVASARLSESSGAILSALRSAGEVEEGLEDQMISGTVAILEIGGDTDYADLKRTVGEIDPSIRNAVGQEALSTWIIKKLDSSELTASAIDSLTVELDSSTPDFAKIAKAVGAVDGDGFLEDLERMSGDELSAISKSISDGRAAKGRIETQGEQAFTSSVDTRILGLRDSIDMVSDRQAIEERIIAQNNPDRMTQIKRLNENFVVFANNAQKKLNISYNSYEAIDAAVRDGKPYPSPNINEQKAYTLLKAMHKINRTSTESAMSSKLSVLKKKADNEVKQVVIDSKVVAATAGRRMSKSDLADVGKEIFGDAPVFVSDLGQFPRAVEMFKQGVVLPQVASAMSMALESNDPNEIQIAIQFFEQGVNSTQTLPSGQEISADSMRNSLSEDDYALYDSVLFAARKYSEDPTAVLVSLRSYEGNMDADLKLDFGIASSAPLSRILDETPMSPQYRKQILSSLKIIKSKGGSVGPETLDRLIESYTRNAVVDDAIVGYSIGDMSVYGRLNYVGAADVVRNEQALVDLMVQDKGYADVLKGGNATDAAIESLGFLSLRTILGESAAIYELITGGGLKATTAAARARELARGMEVIQEKLLYRPNIKSFNAGQPSWTVGYEDGAGFVPIAINGREWTLDANVRESNDRGEARFQANMALVFAKRANAPSADIAIATIKTMATLEHMDINTFLKSKDVKSGRMAKALEGLDPVELFTEAREKYESLP